MGVSKNSGTPKSSILIGFSIIFTIHYGGFTPIFGSTPISFASRKFENLYWFNLWTQEYRIWGPSFVAKCRDSIEIHH